MKKKLFIMSAVLFMLMSFASCRKCVDCIAYDRTNNTPVYYETICGRKKAVDLSADLFVTIHTDSYTYAKCD